MPLHIQNTVVRIVRQGMAEMLTGCLLALAAQLVAPSPAVAQFADTPGLFVNTPGLFVNSPGLFANPAGPPADGQVQLAQAPAPAAEAPLQPANAPAQLPDPAVQPGPAGPECLPPPVAAGVPQLPPDFLPWWQEPAARPLHEPDPNVQMDVDSVLLGTLMYSPKVQILRDAPLVRRSEVQQAEARFDVTAFMDSRYFNTNDPVGNTLTTGGPDRWLDAGWYSESGLRQKNEWGGQVQISQRLGHEDSNSLYFLPTDQGTTHLALKVTQPLLNGAGKPYNTSLIMLAQIDQGVACTQLSRDLQALLVDVHRAYWDLYGQRVLLLQKRKLYQQSLDILAELNARREVDVLESQIVRAEAAVAGRESAVIRLDASVRNAEARLRSLINDPQLLGPCPPELIPTQMPAVGYCEPCLGDNLIKALRCRPEIGEATQTIRSASVKADVAQQDLLPVLNVVLEGYVAGLRGNNDISGSWLDQFSAGSPSVTAGFQFEVPLGNRLAQSRLLQRQVELRQAVNGLQLATANIRAEVEVAVREVTTSYREMVSRFRAMVAFQAEIEQLTQRWRLLPGDQTVAGVVLDELLTSQERLANAEGDFLAAQVNYQVSTINLARVTGVLLACQNIDASGFPHPVPPPAGGG